VHDFRMESNKETSPLTSNDVVVESTSPPDSKSPLNAEHTVLVFAHSTKHGRCNAGMGIACMWGKISACL
jgi:hypothetical protein